MKGFTVILCSSDSHVLVMVHPVILKFSRPLYVQSGDG